MRINLGRALLALAFTLSLPAYAGDQRLTCTLSYGAILSDIQDFVWMLSATPGFVSGGSRGQDGVVTAWEVSDAHSCHAGKPCVDFVATRTVLLDGNSYTDRLVWHIEGQKFSYTGLDSGPGFGICK